MAARIYVFVSVYFERIQVLGGKCLTPVYIILLPVDHLAVADSD